MATIGVFGSSRREENGAFYKEAYELGSLLARARHVVLTGGYGGSMGAVSRGAHAAGGHVLGITCAIFDPLAANEWVSEEVKAASMLERLQTMITRSDGFVALQGSVGTLSELTLVWSLLHTRTITKPLVLLGSQWRGVMAALLKYTDLTDQTAGWVTVVDTPAEVLPALVAPPAPSGPPPRG